jgi:undecaprenyl-diphosphatase
MPEWIQDIDSEVLHWFKDKRNDFLTYNLNNITALGSTTVLALVVLCALGFLVLTRHFKRAFFVAVLIVAAYFATEGLKDQVNRHRPPPDPPAKAKKSKSFPSSHASLSMSVFLLLALCLRPPSGSGRQPWTYRYAVLWALFLAGIVGVSRLYFGYHYLSDVIGGWLLGLGIGMIFYIADRATDRLA